VVKNSAANKPSFTEHSSIKLSPYDNPVPRKLSMFPGLAKSAHLSIRPQSIPEGSREAVHGLPERLDRFFGPTAVAVNGVPGHAVKSFVWAKAGKVEDRRATPAFAFAFFFS